MKSGLEPISPLPPQAPVGPFGWLIHDALLRLGLGQEKFADRVNKAAKDLGNERTSYNRQNVWHWLHGVVPRPEANAWIATAAGLSVEEVSEAARAQREARRSARYQIVAQRAVTDQLRQSETNTVRVKAATGDAASTSPWEAAEQSALFAEWAESSNVGSATVDQFGEEIQAIVHDYNHQAPALVFERTHRLRQRLITLLQGHQYPGQARDLYLFAGQLSAILAWISGDLGDLTHAERHGTAAWVCAELADHDGLRACTLATRSKTAFWRGRYAQAVDLARLGLRWSPPTTISVLLACREASAWAQLGATGAADSALRHAKERLDQVSRPDDMAGVFACGPGRHANYAAVVELRLGNSVNALRYAQLARDCFVHGEGTHFGTEAQVQITTAAAFLACGDLDTSITTLNQLLKIAPEQRLDTLVRRLAPISSMLVDERAAGARQASDIKEMVHEFCTNAVVGLPKLKSLPAPPMLVGS